MAVSSAEETEAELGSRNEKIFEFIEKEHADLSRVLNPSVKNLASWGNSLRIRFRWEDLEYFKRSKRTFGQKCRSIYGAGFE